MCGGVLAWFPMQDWTPLLPQLKLGCREEQSWVRMLSILTHAHHNINQQHQTTNIIILFPSSTKYVH